MFLWLCTHCKSSQKSTTSCQLWQVQRGTHVPAVACDSHLETAGIIAPLTWDESCLSTNLPRPASLICILTSDHISGGEGNAFYYLVLNVWSFCVIPGVNLYHWVPARKGLLYSTQLMSLCSGRVTVLKFQTWWAQQRPEGHLCIHGVVPFL